MRKYVFTKNIETKQLIQQDHLFNDTIEPFISFDDLLELFYVNSYHRRAILIKAGILSQIEDSGLNEILPPETSEKEFLYAMAVNLEIYGNTFIEEAGSGRARCLYILPTVEARLLKDMGIAQKVLSSGEIKPVNGCHLRYYSPASRFYGEPDYMAVYNQIQIEQKINEYNNAFFDNGARPDFAVIFENSEPSDEQIAAFQEFFETSFKGRLNAHKTLIISAPNGTADENPAKIRLEKLNAVEDMSFKNLKEINRDEIIAAHGVPPRLAGVMAAGQLGGGGELISQLHSFNELVIKPKQKLIEGFFENKIGCKLQLKQFDISNYKDDADIVRGLVSMGIISVQEARDMMGWRK